MTDLIPIVRDAKKLIAIGLFAVIFAAICTGTGVKITADFAQNKYDLLVESNKRQLAEREKAVETAARASQKQQDAITLASALAAASAQTRIVTRYSTIMKEVPRYVTVETDARSCIPYGLVRLLDAAALGRGPADLELPPGVTDDACSPLTASALAAGILGNYQAFDANAAQLDALIADTKARIDAAQPATSSPPRDGHSWNDVEKDHPGLTVIAALPYDEGLTTP